MTEITTERLNKWTERLIALLITIVISFVATMYYDQKGKIDRLENNVSILQQDKVSKADLKEEIDRLRNQNDANKSDIISRIDLLSKYLQPSYTVNRRNQE